MWGFACVFVFTVQGSLVPDRLVVENSIPGRKGVGQAKALLDCVLTGC